MTRKNYRTVFMGTSEFAVPALEELMASNFNIVAVFCRPDKKQGRGLKPRVCPLKESVQKYNIPIFQPKSLKDKKVIAQIRDLKPDVMVVASYGLLIPKEILDIPKRGTLNIHPSLLPKYRGPSPIQQALLDDTKETGVSLMLLDHKMDHGPVIAQRKIEISKKDNRITLSGKLANLGTEILIKNLPLYLEGKIKPRAQDHKKATFTKILKREDGRIDWSNSAFKISRQIKAYLGWPGTFTSWQERRVIILEGEAISQNRYRKKDGAVFEINGKLYVQCGEGILKIKKIQLAGKKPVTGAEFFRGYPKILGAILTQTTEKQTIEKGSR